MRNFDPSLYFITDSTNYTEEEFLYRVEEALKGIDELLTVTEVAKMFSVSGQTVLKWINNGKIKAVKVVKVYRIPKEEIDRLIDKQRKEDEGK